MPVTEPCFAAPEADEADLFAAIRHRDVLVHHPYTSFASSVEAFVARAATDPHVLAIKMTLYRTSGDSPVVASLVRAAEAGKQVVALVELKARFDERANIGWARRLEKAGVHVVYGLVGLKTHAKVVLVVRDDADGLRRYCHIGTGNYNQSTARLYEDLGLFTADATIGDDLIDLFNLLTGFSDEPRFRRLLVAPHDLRGALLRLIENEAASARRHRSHRAEDEQRRRPGDHRRARGRRRGRGGDRPDRAGHLLPACPRRCHAPVPAGGRRPGPSGCARSSAASSSTPGSPTSPTARGKGRPAWYIGSADLMPRNLDRRVEVLVPVDDPALRDRLQQIVDVNLADNTLAWELTRKGNWRRVRPAPGRGSVRRPRAADPAHRRTGEIAVRAADEAAGDVTARSATPSRWCAPPAAWSGGPTGGVASSWSSCTAPVAPTGASPRASSNQARTTRPARCARWRRRPVSTAVWDSSSVGCATGTSATVRRSSAGGR